MPQQTPDVSRTETEAADLNRVNFALNDAADNLVAAADRYLARAQRLHDTAQTLRETAATFAADGVVGPNTHAARRVAHILNEVNNTSDLASSTERAMRRAIDADEASRGLPG